MKFKKYFKLIPCFSLCLLFACGKNSEVQKLPGLQKQKTDTALDSCRALNPQDIGLNGKFLYYFPQCASNKTADGGETLKGAVNMVKAFGIKGLGQLAELLMTDPKQPLSPKNGAVSSVKYPLIRALMTFMERGVNSSKSADVSAMQTFLMDMNPYLLANLMLDMSEDGSLKRFLDEFEAFTQSVDIKPIFGATRTFLTDRSLGEAFAKTANNILDNPDMYSPMKDMLTLDQSLVLNQTDKESCLKSWRDPRLQGTERTCTFVEKEVVLPADKVLEKINKIQNGEKVSESFAKIYNKAVGTKQIQDPNLVVASVIAEINATMDNVEKTKLFGKTGADRYEQLLSDLQADRNGAKKISEFLSHIISEFFSTESEKRLGVAERLIDGGTQAFLEQDGPIRNLVGLLHYFTEKDQRGEYKVKVKDFEEIVRSFDHMLKVAGPEVLVTLNHKVASSKLHAQIEKLLYNGGAISGCEGVTIAGLKDSKRFDISLLTESLLTPNSQCLAELPPIAAHVISTINKAVGCVDGDDECFEDDALERVSEKLKSFDWSEIKNIGNSNPHTIREFLVVTLEELKANLEKDPYTLYWQHMAKGEVRSADIDKVLELINYYSSITPEVIAEIDEDLERNLEMKKLFHPAFLENIVNFKIMQLSATAEQFSGLFADGGDAKAKRVFTGAYNFGPLENLMTKDFYINSLDSDVRANLPNDIFRVKETLARLRAPGVLFYNERLDAYGEEDGLGYKLLGRQKNSVRFRYEKEASRKYVLKGFEIYGGVTTTDDIFSDDYWRLEGLLVDDEMLGKDVKNDENDLFLSWVKNNLTDSIVDKDWNEFAKNNPQRTNIDTRFFESETYSTAEARQLALFYSLNYLMAPGYFPEEGTYQVEEVITKSKPSVVQAQFATLPSETNEEWSTYVKYFPALLADGSKASLKDISDGIFATMDAEKFSNLPWKELPGDKRGKRTLKTSKFNAEELETVKILSALQLMTYNNHSYKKFMSTIAVGDHCYDKKNKATNCPITFVDLVKENGEVVSKFDSLKKYVQRNLVMQFCPLLNTEQAFSSKMQSVLGLGQLSGEMLEICADSSANLFNATEGQIPAWIHHRVLGDVFAMGKNPKLKKGLSTLGMQIRYHKSLKKNKNRPFLFVKDLLNSPGFIPAEMMGHAGKLLADHKGFYTTQPGSLNTYINFLMSQLDVMDSESAYDLYGAGITIEDDLESGVIYDLIRNVLINKYDQWNTTRGDDSILLFVVDLLHELNKPEREKHIEALAAFIAYPQDLETLPTYNKALPLLLQYLKDEPSDKQFWQRDGTYVLRQFMHQENIRMLTDVAYGFDLDELIDGAKIALNAFTKLGTPDEAVSIFDKLVTFLRLELSGRRADGRGTIEIVEEGFKRVLLANKIDGFFRYFNRFADAVMMSHIDFSNKKTAPVFDQLGAIIDFGINHIHKLLDIYQGSFKNKDSNQDYFRDMAKGLIAPFDKDSSGEGAASVAELMENDDLGSWDSLYKEILFNDNYQPLLINTLKSANKVELIDYQKAIEESDILVPATHNMLRYVVSRGQWGDRVSQDTKDAVEALMRLSSPGNYVWRNQIDLIDSWLSYGNMTGY